MKDKNDWLKFYKILMVTLNTTGVKGVMMTLDVNGELEANVVMGERDAKKN